MAKAKKAVVTSATKPTAKKAVKKTAKKLTGNIIFNGGFPIKC